MAVLDDIIDGSELVQTDTEITKTRIAYVTGVTGTNEEREYDAMITSGVPVLGEALGSSTPLSNVKVIELKASPVSNQPNTMQVVIVYSSRRTALADPSDSDLPTYESGTVLQQEQTNADKDGSFISLSYTYAADADSKSAGKTVLQGAMVSVFKPSTTETMQRVEVDIEPTQLANAFVGKVNAAAWLTGAAGDWLCMGITGNSPDGGTIWNMTYQFAYRSGGWNPEAAFVDPETGKPPTDVVQNTGIKTIDSYNTAEFADLYLL